MCTTGLAAVIVKAERGILDGEAVVGAEPFLLIPPFISCRERMTRSKSVGIRLISDSISRQ